MDISLRPLHSSTRSTSLIRFSLPLITSSLITTVQSNLPITSHQSIVYTRPHTITPPPLKKKKKKKPFFSLQPYSDLSLENLLIVLNCAFKFHQTNNNFHKPKILTILHRRSLDHESIQFQLDFGRQAVIYYFFLLDQRVSCSLKHRSVYQLG